MGGDRTTSTTTQQAEATQEERELNRLQLERTRAAQPQLIDVQSTALDLSKALLTGQPLPGYLGKLPGGISPEAIGAEATNLATKTLTELQPLGITDSGILPEELSRRITSRILFPSEQFNLQNLQQLINLAVGGQAQVQSPILSTEASLGSRLAGLRSTTSSTTQTAMNPFLRSFQTSAGQFLGSAGGTTEAAKDFWGTA